ncbi:MAG TPA: DUF177 domain-containing protein [Clostridiales bacterium]|nr:DUF177 domain-containing protein [Clostridiales bacterium]
MRIKIDKLKEGGNSEVFEADEISELLSTEKKIIRTEELCLKIEKSDDYLHIHGSCSVSYEDSCDRCAEDFETELIVNIDYYFHIGEINGAASDDVEIIYPEESNGELLFDDHLKESFILSLPLKNLCSDNCRGLCVGCGANLNLDKCSCPVKSDPDPRWDTLTKLLNKDK